jgi:hypothetical protein
MWTGIVPKIQSISKKQSKSAGPSSPTLYSMDADFMVLMVGNFEKPSVFFHLPDGAD